MPLLSLNLAIMIKLIAIFKIRNLRNFGKRGTVSFPSLFVKVLVSVVLLIIVALLIPLEVNLSRSFITLMRMQRLYTPWKLCFRTKGTLTQLKI